jgi:hypothetical protein
MTAQAGGVPWTRATLAWMLMMLVETVHGIAREVMLAPVIGDLRARQWGVLVGSLLVLAIACALSGWLRATTRGAQWVVGGYWLALTVLFEVLVGRATHMGWPRILANYNPAEGGFMVLGLLVMFLAPWLVARWLKNWRR